MYRTSQLQTLNTLPVTGHMCTQDCLNLTGEPLAITIIQEKEENELEDIEA